MLYIYLNNITTGPLSTDDLRSLLAQQKITPATPCCNDRPGSKWQTVADFIAHAPAPKPPSPQALPQGVYIRQKGSLSIFACPQCKQHYELTFAEYAGRKCYCGKCQTTFVIPAQLPTAATQNTTETSPADIHYGDLLCPHCWQSFDSDSLLYIAVHPSLVGDPVLGDFAPKRFTPSTFNVQGLPLDECGLPATDTACPYCHLEYPVAMVDNPTLYMSIAGATSSGKSYYLTVLIHRLRETLPHYFNQGFADLAPKMNATVSNYEKQIYMSLTPDKITALPATQIAGEGISDRVLLNNAEIELPKPFIYVCRSEQSNGTKTENNLVFYDNSGEMFFPGRDGWENQATFHLSHSNGIMFLFDPTNDAAMCRELCDAEDPQVSQRPRAVDQVIIFNEMISRIRRHANLAADERCDIPLVVVIGKYDTWHRHFDRPLHNLSPFVVDDTSLETALDLDMIADVSFAARQLMLSYAPGLVDTAERFFRSVFFIPVSTFGTMAEMDSTGFIGIVPAKLRPIWVEIPTLTLLAQNHVIPVAPQTDDNRQSTTLQCKIQNEQIVFRHPTTGDIVRLPGNYAGRRLTINGKDYRLPALPASTARSQASANPWK